MAQPTEGSAGSGAIDFAVVFATLPTPYLVMTPDLVIVEANAAYLATVGRERDDIVGREVFDAFPPTPDALDENGVPRVKVSFERARDTGLPDTMPMQKYDIPAPDGSFVERYWSLISVPVVDATGTTVLLLQRTEDVTDFVREREQGRAELERDAEWQRRVEEVESDLFARAGELRAAIESRDVAARRLAALAEAALRLARATTVEELTGIVIEAGTGALGAAAVAVGIRDEVTGVVRLWASVPGVDELPLDGPMPASVAARTGDAVLLGSEAMALEWSPEMRDVPTATGQRSWAALPLRTSGRLLGSLTASWTEERVFSGVERELLGAFAAQCAQTLDRIQVREAEQRASAESRRLSETLQRSLLTEPPPVAGLQLAVRYQPAAQEVQVGGDWYDAFVVPDGALTVVVGDVTGHDRIAAAAMAQIRNVLRGVAQSVSEPPAAVLSALDVALRNLAVEVLATCVLVQIREDAAVAPGRSLTWSSAGHPPPLLLAPDGGAVLLSQAPDLLLGVDPGTDRRDHERVLMPGETLLLYTDGLVERRGEGLDAGLERLRAGVDGWGARPLEQLCDDVLGLLGQDLSDDVALLAVRLQG